MRNRWLCILLVVVMILQVPVTARADGFGDKIVDFMTKVGEVMTLDSKYSLFNYLSNYNNSIEIIYCGDGSDDIFLMALN